MKFKKERKTMRIQAVKEYKRRALSAELKQFCIHADENSFIEVTEWSNGEGFDVEISTTSSRFQLTWGEYDALKKIVKKLK